MILAAKPSVADNGQGFADKGLESEIGNQAREGGPCDVSFPNEVGEHPGDTPFFLLG